VELKEYYEIVNKAMKGDKEALRQMAEHQVDMNKKHLEYQAKTDKKEKKSRKKDEE
jgi:hypothetical protein